MRKIKLVICDLDGTLLNSRKQISNVNKEAIHACRNKGIRFGIASGRPLEPILRLIKEWNIEDIVDCVVAMNGGITYDCISQTRKEYYLLDGDIIREIMDHFEGMDVRYQIFDGEVRYVNKGSEESRRKAYDQYREIEKITDLYAFCEKPHNKIIISCDPSYMEQVVKRSFSYTNDACVCFKTAPDLFEYVDPRVNKSFGVEKICESYGINMDEVLAFGDTSNDNEMLRDAGVGVWMSNGSEDTKKMADAITLSNDENGVGVYLQQTILNVNGGSR